MTQRAGVLGLGLIGGSLALALRRQGFRVAGHDADRGALQSAGALGLIDEPHHEPAACAADADLVVLAMPVAAILSALPTVDTAAPPTALIVDTGSVKGPIVEAMERLPGARRAVGGHPLAGSELSGPGSARADLFAGCPFVLCPSSRTNPTTMERAENLARSLGATPRTIAAGRHDEILARTSHVPQFLSTLLAISTDPGDEQFAGPALRDMTRLALSNPEMWRDIARLNGVNLARDLRGIGRRLDSAAELIERGDGAGIETLLRDGGEAATRIRQAAHP